MHAPRIAAGSRRKILIAKIGQQEEFYAGNASKMESEKSVRREQAWIQKMKGKEGQNYGGFF